MVVLFAAFFSICANAWETDEAYVKADKKLNEIYATFIKTAGKENERAIKAAQVAWIRFKEEHCQVGYDATSVSSRAPMYTALCLTAATEDRIYEINRIMEMNSSLLFPFYSGDFFLRDDFTNMLRVFGTIGYNKSEFMDKLSREVAGYDNANWKKYVQATCDFSKNYTPIDERDICEARLNFVYLRNFHLSQ
jgi:uncharacterized protein YecT (DUF1311 family)